jgi:FixJ family two-component response regulator
MVPTVVVIDDDLDVREALQGLFRSVGLNVDLYDSVHAYRESDRQDPFGCMVLDVRLPGKSGLEFQEELVRENRPRPIVFISGHADVEMSVRAMKSGAVEFLTKPVRDQDLLEAVHLAIEQDRAGQRAEQSLQQVRADYSTLSQREREVMSRVVMGHRNKRVALDIGLTEATVKLHRSQIMRKMKATSLVELLRMADTLSSTTKV